MAKHEQSGAKEKNRENPTAIIELSHPSHPLGIVVAFIVLTPDP